MAKKAIRWSGEKGNTLVYATLEHNPFMEGIRGITLSLLVKAVESGTKKSFLGEKELAKMLDGLIAKVNYLSSGYYLEGVYTGPWEKSYPTEYSEEKTIDHVQLFYHDGEKEVEIEVERDLQVLLFEDFAEFVDADCTFRPGFANMD